MAQRYSAGKVLFMAVIASATWLLACNPTPDYRIELRNIPSDAALLLVGWKSASDVVSRTSLAVPLSQLSAESRQRTSISLGILDIPEATGVLSIAVADQDRCITAVTSTEIVTRSSGGTVSMVEVDLDGAANPRVVSTEPLPSPPVLCPPNPPFPPYPPPVACHKVPGLDAIPSEPTLLPTRPVATASIRQYKGPARVFNEGGFSLYGWGLDRATINFDVLCDPSRCMFALAQSYPQYAALLLSPFVFRYPQLKLAAYGQIDLPFSEIKNFFGPDPGSAFANGVILCLSVSAASFRLTNPDGASTSFAEALPKM